MPYPVTVTRCVRADIPDVTPLWTAVRNELIADFGSTITITTKGLRAAIQQADHPWIVVKAVDAGNVVRGSNIFTIDDEANWTSLMTATDKMLALRDRLSVFLQMMKWVTLHAGPRARGFGTVKANGNLDNWLLAHVPCERRSDGTLAGYTFIISDFIPVVDA